MNHLRILSTVLLSTYLCSNIRAQIDEDLWSLSIEQLLNTPVISVSKKMQRGFEVPASITVITSDNIDRSGDLLIPDMIRNVPGMAVGQNTAGNWSITSRGFGGRFSNKLLVLMDGRSIYNPAYSGTLWNTHNFMLDDIDRIEIVRGPGGTHWGINAMNGVINILSKSAFDTVGGVANAITGSNVNYAASARYGAHLSEDTAFRVSTNVIEHKGSHAGFDGFTDQRADFRLDSLPSDKLSITIQGGYSDSSLNDGFLLLNPVTFQSSPQANKTDLIAYHLLTKLVREYDNGELSIKAYVDINDFQSLWADYNSKTYDLESIFRTKASDIHEIMIGIGAKHLTMELPKTISKNGNALVIQENAFNLFIQDEITLTEKDTVSIGTKIEYFTNNIGAQFEPSIRGTHSWSENNITWASISQATRSPSIAEREIATVPLSSQLTQTPNGPLFVLSHISPNPNDVDVEKMTAFELGHRVQMSERTILSASVFTNHYKDLLVIDYVETQMDLALPIPTLRNVFYVRNGSDPVSYGGEISIDHMINESLSALLSYSYINIDMKDADRIRKDPTGFVQIASLGAEENVPSNQFSLVLDYDPMDSLKAQASVRYVGAIRPGPTQISAYTELDLSLQWSISDNMSISITGKNLLDTQHPEYDMILDIQTLSSEVERTVYCKLKYQF